MLEIIKNKFQSINKNNSINLNRQIKHNSNEINKLYSLINEIQEELKTTKYLNNNLIEQLKELKQEQLRNNSLEIKSIQIKPLSNQEQLIYNVYEKLKTNNQHTFNNISNHNKLKKLSNNLLRTKISHIRNKGHNLEIKKN